MSMHLEGPWLSTTGKKKGKQKFRTAEHARKSRELEESWQAMQKKWGLDKVKSTKKSKSNQTFDYKLAIPEGRNTTAHIKSLDSGLGFAARQETPKYTGTSIKGIGTMHKSNAVPIFSDEEAQDIAKMRR
jgi:hypothetical protein